jgi:hypothetical protein
MDGATEAVLNAAVDVASIVGNEGTGFVGFTAATGEGYQNHDILSWDFRPGAAIVSSSIQFADEGCLPNRTLCTPEQGSVEQLGSRRYAVRLPAHLAWGVSIDDREGGAMTIRKLRGTVCWNAQAKVNHACNGPEGDPAFDREALLDSKRTAGTLVSERRGEKVFFSVNAKRGDFDKNEGFFEFEVEFAEKK